MNKYDGLILAPRNLDIPQNLLMKAQESDLQWLWPTSKTSDDHQIISNKPRRTGMARSAAKWYLARGIPIKEHLEDYADANFSPHRCN